MVPAVESGSARVAGQPAYSIWLSILWFAALLALAYFAVLAHLVDQWTWDEDVSHGFFVPLVAGYILWQRREKIASIPAKSSKWGWAVLAWGTAQGYVGTLGAEMFLQRTAFLITLVGVILLVGGKEILRECAFPLLLLPFMIPIPEVLYNQITFPLQLFASRVAEAVLAAIGIPVLRDGNILELASQKLSVAEACSGIRSLLSLAFLSLVYAYFFDSRIWMRWVLLAFTVPIAIVANAGRVTITGILSEMNPELATGFFHSAEGWIVFMAGLIMVGLTHVAISKIVGAKKIGTGGAAHA